jgi:hypothetical protein
MRIAAMTFFIVGCAVEPYHGTGLDVIGYGDGYGVTCNGDDVSNFCDDCNPCTDDANCTPCDRLPPGVKPSIYTCGGWLYGPGDQLSPICFNADGIIAATGCQHRGTTTPPGQSNSCFPRVDAEATGVCRDGACVKG